MPLAQYSNNFWLNEPLNNNNYQPNSNIYKVDNHTEILYALCFRAPNWMETISSSSRVWNIL